jgi:nucleotide-binding universal stress UspA family protein
MTCLIQINRTSTSLAGLYAAASRYRRCRAACLLHVIPSGRPAEVEAGQRVLSEAVRKFRSLDREIRVEGRLEIGAIAEQIVQVAEEIDAALIVMSAYGDGEFPQLGVPLLGGLGRVARFALERGRRPVLLVSAADETLYRPGRSRTRRLPGSQLTPVAT